MAVRPLLQVARRIGTADTKTAREVRATIALQNMVVSAMVRLRGKLERSPADSG